MEIHLTIYVPATAVIERCTKFILDSFAAPCGYITWFLLGSRNRDTSDTRISREMTVVFVLRRAATTPNNCHRETEMTQLGCLLVLQLDKFCIYVLECRPCVIPDAPGHIPEDLIV
jgi:hypothetical protein